MFKCFLRLYTYSIIKFILIRFIIRYDQRHFYFITRFHETVFCNLLNLLTYKYCTWKLYIRESYLLQCLKTSIFDLYCLHFYLTCYLILQFRDFTYLWATQLYSYNDEVLRTTVHVFFFKRHELLKINKIHLF